MNEIRATCITFSMNKRGKTSYRTGTSGWNYRHWRGILYPEGVGAKKWFSYYAGEFDTVEVNYSFYRWPTRKTIERWYTEAPDTFLFTLKAPGTITHRRRLRECDRLVEDFYALTSMLQEKRGAHLFQLPPQFRPTPENTEQLARFIQLLDPELENVIEFRHPEWWQESTYQLLARHGITFCIVHGLDLPPDPVITSKNAYFRFHSTNYSSSYTETELAQFANTMQELPVEKVYAYFNNDAQGYAVMNARELKKALGEE